MKLVVVPAMIFVSGAFMAVAWLAHLRIREHGFWVALAMSWAIVLPEYVLNVAATRYGYGTFTGAQMASFHLCSGVVCVALVSRYVLGETLATSQLVGFGLLAVAMLLVLRRH
ncbi:MAG TPA: DMT family protein [Polyangiaceae bacterium]|nr:DMT family protein [Polyangiaceae bacterium]